MRWSLDVPYGDVFEGEKGAWGAFEGGGADLTPGRRFSDH